MPTIKAETVMCTHELGMTDLEFLKLARVKFADHGGAYGALVGLTGRVCALGALNSTCTGDPERWHEHNAVEFGLDRKSGELYGSTMGCISYVNDNHGYDAAMKVYDALIKQWEDDLKEIETRTSAE